MPSKLVCLVGLPGAGKTEAAEYLMAKRKYGYVRFGQIVLDEVIASGKKSSEELERKIREDMRRKHGMAAIAKLNVPKFDALLKQSDVIGDGLYSWEEYLFLKERYKNRLIVIAIYAPPEIRYKRLINRGKRHGKDTKLQFRSFSKKEAITRDKAQIENLHQAGPIAMAEYTAINKDSIMNLRRQLSKIAKDINS